MLLLKIRAGHSSTKTRRAQFSQKKKIESADTFSHAVFSLLDFLRDGTDWLSQNVGKELPFYAA